MWSCGVPARGYTAGGHRCFLSNESHKITVRETILMVSLENLIFRLMAKPFAAQKSISSFIWIWNAVWGIGFVSLYRT